MNTRERKDMPWIIAAFGLVVIVIVVSGFLVGWR
jgi:hypothetical protein